MFQSLDLSARDSWTLFKLLDEAGNGDINLSVSGFQGPKGPKVWKGCGKKSLKDLKSAPVSTRVALKLMIYLHNHVELCLHQENEYFVSGTQIGR